MTLHKIVKACFLNCFGDESSKQQAASSKQQHYAASLSTTRVEC